MGRDANDDLREGGAEAVTARFARAKPYKANGKAGAHTTKLESDVKPMDEALDLLRGGYSIEQVVAHFARMERERLIKVSEIPSKKMVLEWAAKEGVAVSPTDKPAEPKQNGQDTTKGEKGPSQATALAELAMGDDVELFHTPGGDAYADIWIDGHRETWSVRSRGFKFWLRGAYFRKTRLAAGNDAASSALDIIEAQAQFGGVVRDVYLRVAEHDGRVYINLADTKWRAVEIDPDGWRVVDKPPVRFVRKYGMLEIPEPVRGGKISELRKHMRMTDEGFALSVAWVLAAMRQRGPYPVLALTGEQGTAKSTTLKMLRNLVDPNAAPLRATPEGTRDLYVAAINGHVITFDNVSYLSSDVSDAMCRLSTGGGFSTRALYTDDEERLFDGQRPQGLNGIGAVVSRPDLLERTLSVQLEAVPDADRKLEDELWGSFNAARPRMLGALYDAVSHGLKHVAEVSLTFLVPIGNMHYPDLWCHVWRDPRGGLTTNRRARFVSSLLLTELRAWFSFFGGAKIAKGLAGAVELHARHDWNAYAWFGEQAFPAPKEHPQAFLNARAAYQARKAKGKRPQAQAAAE